MYWKLKCLNLCLWQEITSRQDKPRSLGFPPSGVKFDDVTQWVISTISRGNPTWLKSSQQVSSEIRGQTW